MVMMGMRMVMLTDGGDEDAGDEVVVALVADWVIHVCFSFVSLM